MEKGPHPVFGVRELEIPWRLLDRELSDRGVYILVLHITEGRVLDVGGIGQVRFPQGSIFTPAQRREISGSASKGT